MHLRNIEGAGRDTHFNRTMGARTPAKDVTTKQDTIEAGTASRGAFFEMMLNAQPPDPPRAALPKANTANSASTDQNSSAVRGNQTAAPRQAPAQPPVAQDPVTQPPVTNAAPKSSEPVQSSDLNLPETDVPPPISPVDSLNALLSKLGYDPTTFNAQVTSAHIAVPGLAYDYPLLEVTVNGERVGFHLPSAMHDMRMTAANISSMMGKPVMSLGVFA